MDRRRSLEWLSGLLAAGCAALLAIPGASYIVGAVRPQPSPGAGGATRRRVGRLKDLPVNRPVSLAVTGKRRDAWTTYPEQPIAQLWFLRRDDDAVAPEKTRISAFGTICPHLKCRVLMDVGQKQFICPCHKGAFHLDGQPISDKELGYHNPVPRGLDEYACHVVKDDRDEWWVEVEYVG